MKLAPIGEYQNTWVELECLVRKLVRKPKERYPYFPPLMEEVQKLDVLNHEDYTDLMVHYTYYITRKEANINKLKKLKDLVILLRNYEENSDRHDNRKYA